MSGWRTDRDGIIVPDDYGDDDSDFDPSYDGSYTGASDAADQRAGLNAETLNLLQGVLNDVLGSSMPMRDALRRKLERRSPIPSVDADYLSQEDLERLANTEYVPPLSRKQQGANPLSSLEPETHKRHIVRTIQKLLRLSHANSPEAAIAGIRARELMERHGVHVSVESARDARVPVPCVTGMFWREQLLFAACIPGGCRALKNTDGSACVAGPSSEAPRVVQRYGLAHLDLASGAYTAWWAFASIPYTLKSLTRSRPGGRVIHPQMIICAPLWFRLYLNSAASTVVQQVTEATRDRSRDTEDAVMRKLMAEKQAAERAIGIVAPTEKTDFDEELEATLAEMLALGEKITRVGAEKLQKKAAQEGERRARESWRLLLPERKALPPARPRSRFTELDL